MNQPQWNKKATTFLVALSTATIMVGCGGGSKTTTGGGSNTTAVNDSTSLPQIKIDASNQKQALATLFDSVDITTPQLPLSASASSDGSIQLANSTQTQLAKVLPNYKSLSRTPSGEPYTCNEGGSISASADGSASIISYDNCNEANTTTNGQLKVSYSETTKEIIYTMTDYSMVNKNSEYTTSSTTYTVSADNIKYSSTGKVTIDGETIEFDHYNYTLSLVDSKVNISVDGAVKTACIGNWIKVKTNQVMQLGDNTCPTAGEIEVQGDNSKLKVEFKSDKSISIYLNDALTQQYEDCNQMPESSGVCGE
jgi:hypothetical protein